MRQYYVYILSNFHDTVLYIGMTNDLIRRMEEHRNKTAEGFSRRYNLYKLVSFESTGDVREALAREKQLKSWSRKKKNALIESVNPMRRDLCGDLT